MSLIRDEQLVSWYSPVAGAAVCERFIMMHTIINKRTSKNHLLSAMMALSGVVSTQNVATPQITFGNAKSKFSGDDRTCCSHASTAKMANLSKVACHVACAACVLMHDFRGRFCSRPLRACTDHAPLHSLFRSFFLSGCICEGERHGYGACSQTQQPR